MKDSGIEWIGEIPESWETKRNKQLFFEVNERCENGNEHTLLSVSEYYGIAPKSDKISDGEFETRAESLDGYKLCKVGDIVMNIMLAWKRSTGRSEYDGIVSPAYCVYRPIEDIDTKYYHYLFRTDIVANLFKQYSTGIIESRLRLYPEKFLALSMLVPPLPEQQAISVHLDRQCALIDSVTEKTKASIEEYKKLRQAVITQAVTKGVRGDRPMKDSGIEWIGEIPEEWDVYRIANLYTERKEQGNDELPILTVSINTGVSDRELADDETARVFVRSEDKSKYMKVCPGDLTYNMMRAWQGAFGAVRVEGMVSPAYVIAKPKRDIDSRYMEALLRTPAAKEEMKRYSHGITDFRLRLYWEKFKCIKICFPSVEEQREIADYIDKKCAEIDALIAKKETFLTELESYKKSVIYEYVTGKKEV